METNLNSNKLDEKEIEKLAKECFKLPIKILKRGIQNHISKQPIKGWKKHLESFKLGFKACQKYNKI